MDRHQERLITEFLEIFCNKNLPTYKDYKAKDGRKFSILYPKLEVMKPDGNHSYNAKITYRGKFVPDNGNPIDLWVEDSIKVSVVRENATLGIGEEYITVKFAKNSEFMTVAKKKTFLQMAERYNSMRVVEVK